MVKTHTRTHARARTYVNLFMYFSTKFDVPSHLCNESGHVTSAQTVEIILKWVLRCSAVALLSTDHSLSRLKLYSEIETILRCTTNAVVFVDILWCVCLNVADKIQVENCVCLEENDQ